MMLLRTLLRRAVQGSAHRPKWVGAQGELGERGPPEAGKAS